MRATRSAMRVAPAASRRAMTSSGLMVVHPNGWGRCVAMRGAEVRCDELRRAERRCAETCGVALRGVEARCDAERCAEAWRDAERCARLLLCGCRTFGRERDHPLDGVEA